MPEKPDYSLRIPVGVKSSLDHYFGYHDMPNKGSFMYAILTNNLHNSIFQADDRSMESLKWIVYYLWTAFPKEAWGSVEAVDKWCKK